MPNTVLKSRYEVLSGLLECRFSVLYHAWDRRTGQPVVLRHLRIPNANVDDALLDGIREQFNREARFLGTLVHRGIPKVTDYLKRAASSSW